MQKKIVALAAAFMCAATAQVWAQSSGTSKVELWGVVDAGIRHTTNEGTAQGSMTRMLGGGMSQSRWGINVEEDLGGGTKALVHMEHRFNLDTGAKNTTAPFFQLSYIGLQGPYGRLTAGRQWNVLFDVVSSTYASFPYSPYMDAYKPELGMAAGARSSNSLKYMLATADRRFVAGLQYSFHESAKSSAAGVGQALLADGGAIGSNTIAYAASLANSMQQKGAYFRYSANGFSLGGAFLNTKAPGGSKLDAWTVGGSYRKDKLYINLGYGQNKFKIAPAADALGGQGSNRIVDFIVLSDAWSTENSGGFLPGANPASTAKKRDMIKIGFGYQVTPQINLGAHYYRAKQSGSASPLFNGRANFVVAAANYAFSKRTDAYFAVDNTKVSGGAGMMIDSTSRARSRTGITVGLRHRF